jgi:multiple sugar transport system ATP-binding protein
MASVTLKNLVKKYGKVEAVKGINLHIQDHEFLCLLGPSGCGKSSTLRMVAGLEEITAGEIYIGDRLVNDLWPKERDIAMVFENYALYPHLTTYDNMAFPLRSRKFGESEIRKLISNAARILDIEELLNRNPSELSGGQKQRVAIGRAIVRNPAVFLMDEPISHLDAKLRDQMRGELKRLQKQLGATTLYVSHDQIEAMTMADRIAIMNFGELQQVATPQEVFRKPANKFVAFFVGSPSINFINAEVIEENMSYVLTWDKIYTFNVPGRLKEALSRHLDNSRKITLGIRPQSISVSMQPDKQHILEGKIFITQPLGEEMMVEITMGTHRVTAVTSIEFPGEIEEKVWVGFDEAGLHLFHAETERNILKIS